MSPAPTTQLGFDALLQNADHANLARLMERECAHLPGRFDQAIPFYRALIERHQVRRTHRQFRKRLRPAITDAGAGAVRRLPIRPFLRIEFAKPSKKQRTIALAQSHPRLPSPLKIAHVRILA